MRRPKLGDLQVGDEVPNFVCDSQVGIINLHDAIDGKVGGTSRGRLQGFVG
eukprot:CAMPEP_0185735034 /NCGR_PEP_ID=MMETSP1171-20130828/24156_1 /TAXON_ID=374046 /ORGANISM="Helicotheca tamensis, Strain CCMP826" /LENGTH=50 /DNA_ID=CAMNT_0028405203 /DNA_START=82 /DNA_END=231 /DNA_ORIENTATION=+